jgi:hypothetical protein
VAQRLVEVELVAVLPPVTIASQIARLAEVGDDPLDGSLRDPDAVRDLTEPRFGVASVRR